MVYIKVMQGDTLITAEAHDIPVYVHRQKNNLIVRCSEQNAQGILSLDGAAVYQLEEKASLGLENGMTASYIYQTDYETIVAGVEDTDKEDTEPEVPADSSAADILTRAELTAKVKELEEELQAAKILLGVSE